MILSIIIPIYNTEQYVRKCLSSVLSIPEPTGDDYEVIVINDGTPDNSMAIVEEFRNAPNLTIINQDNQGLSCARNTGMQVARGEYFWFVDSDDQIESESLPKLINMLKEHPEPDIFGFGIIRIEEKTQAETFVHPIPNQRKRYLYEQNTNNEITFDLTGPTQKYVFRKSFLKKHDLKFFPGIYHEDVDFLFRAFFVCNKIYLTCLPIYRYLIRTSGSITSSVKMKNVQDLDLIIKRMPLVIRPDDHSIKNYIYLGFNQLSILNVMLRLIPNPDWKEQHRQMVKANQFLYRKIALRGIIPALTKRSYRMASIAVAICFSPYLYHSKLQGYLNRPIGFHFRSKSK